MSKFLGDLHISTIYAIAKALELPPKKLLDFEFAN